MDITKPDHVEIQDEVVLTKEEAKKFEEYCHAVLLSLPSLEELEPIDTVIVVNPEALEDVPFVDFGEEPAEFEGAEHERTAQNLILYQFNGLERPGATEPLCTVPTRSGTKLDLTFGRIIALAGDHFSNRDNNRTPICGAFYDVDNSPKGKMDRFESAVTSLLQDQDGYLLAVNSLMKEEWDGVALAERDYLSVKQAYHNHQCGLPTDEKFWTAELTIISKHVLKSLSVYSWLGWLNADHFGDDAVECYTAGHHLAMKIARAAAQEPTKGGKSEMLNKAYIHDAFACHFLTDLFSSGHLRSPRRDLHCSDLMTMTASTTLGKFVPHSKGEVPVYDHHARYMHDDDCATGLLVKNKKGDQWICFGDKQLLEPCNRINLAKVQDCVQESVKEIYNKGFLGRDAIDAKSFVALDLIPQPMTAIDGLSWRAAWGNHDIHNPAPLWNVDAGEKNGKKTFTCRSNLNDHSNFNRKECSPEAGWVGVIPTANQGCKDIRDGAFRGDDQFTKSVDVGTLIRAGFVQVQDLEYNQTCINVWAQAVVKGGKSSGQRDTFTIRRRFMDIDGGNPGPQATNLHWLGWYNPQTGNTNVFKIDWVAKGSESEILLSGYALESLGNQSTEYDPTYHAKEEHQPKANILFSKKPLLTGLPSQSGRANLSRFLLGDFTEKKSTSVVDLATVSFAIDGSVRILVQAIDGSQFGTTISQTWPDKLGFKCWVKTLRTPDQKDNILIISLTKRTKNKYFFKVSRIWVTARSVLERAEYTFESYWTGSASDVNVLVGDVLGRGKQDIIVSADGDQVHSSISTFSFSEDMSTLEAKGKHQCDGPDTEYVSPCFTALIPSAKSDSKQLDVLTVRYQRDGKKTSLCFHTHTSKPQAVEKDPWLESEGSTTKYEDTLSTNANFFHIKWLRCTGKSANAVMEVFSYYGVLGVRVFAPSNKNVDWELTGLLPYLGQTSIGAGLGCYKDWGYGFMPWGEAKDFEDINEWSSWRGIGSYGMSEKDVELTNVRGFEVGKRQF